MIEFKHIIATRFFCQNYKPKKLILSNRFLYIGYKLLVENLLQSLDNQISHDFEFVILVHNDLNENSFIYRKLQKLNYIFKIKILKYKYFQAYVNRISKNIDKVILTRIDYDDLIANTCVSEIQSLTLKNNYLIFLYGYNYGYMFDMNSKTLYSIDKVYKDNGHFSAFQSIVYDVKKMKQDNIKLYHPYNWNHCKPLSFFKEKIKNNNLNIIHIERSKSRNYIWMRHNNVASDVIIDTTKFNCKKIHNLKQILSKFK